MLFFFAARSREVYDLTTPWQLGRLHIEVARKAYSVIAFSVAGILADRALGPARRPALRAALVVAAFSVLIEIGQKLHGSHEGLRSNLFDVLCGALGGWLGVRVARALARR